MMHMVAHTGDDADERRGGKTRRAESGKAGRVREGAAVLMSALLAAGAAAAEAAGKPDLRGQRLVCMGDSITDGFSYPLLVKQALEEARVPAPTLICAGIGGDTAAGMEKRLERDVFAHKPTLVTLNAGINDVLRKVKPAEYEASVTHIAAEMKARGIPLLLLTTSVLGAKQAEADARLAEFNAALRALARREGYRVADVNDLMQKARAAGTEAMEEDHVHPNYQGHRIMARALLDALGYADVPVPAEMKVSLMPGIVREWKLRAVAGKATPLDDAAAAALQADATWTAYSLPETEAVANNWWLEQERKRGLAVTLEKALGKAPAYEGLAAIEAAQAKTAYLNTGAALQSVWLNGKRVYAAGEEWKGWHPGRERMPVELRAGRNTLVIRTGNAFFLSITDDNTW